VRATSPSPIEALIVKPVIAAVAEERGRPSAASRTLQWVVLAALDFSMVNIAFYLAWFARYRLGLVLALAPGNYVEHARYVPHQRGIAVSRTLVVGDSTVGRMIMQALVARPHLGYEVAGFLGTNGDSDFGRFHRLGTPDELERVIDQHAIGHVVIALPSASHE